VVTSSLGHVHTVEIDDESDVRESNNDPMAAPSCLPNSVVPDRRL
jgi:hypothetical protein